MKIQIILEGGLGNQMFQYALGRSLSIHYECDLSLYIPLVGAYSPIREYQLSYFGLNGTNEILENSSIISEFSNISFEEIYNLPKNQNFIFRGYWQNEKYFKNYEKFIRNDFNLGVVPKKDRLLVQVRRTDYLNNPYHEYCNFSWYKKAISLMEFEEVVFVSDDMKWCEENFKYIKEKKIFIYGNEIDHLKLMCSCDRFVISNSSFGWWGAWLSGSSNVICPSLWTPGNPSYDPSINQWKKIS